MFVEERNINPLLIVNVEIIFHVDIIATQSSRDFEFYRKVWTCDSSEGNSYQTDELLLINVSIIYYTHNP